MVIVKLLWKKPTGLARFFHIIFWHFTAPSIKPRTEEPRRFLFKKKQENRVGLVFVFSFQFIFTGVPGKSNQTGLRFSNSPLCYHPELDSTSWLYCNLNRDPGKSYDIKLSITDKKFSNSLSKKGCFSSVSEINPERRKFPWLCVN